MALVLPDSQTQPTDQLPVLDAVHVQRMPVVLLTGGGSWLAVPLVLRQQMSKQTDEHKLYSPIRGFQTDMWSMGVCFGVILSYFLDDGPQRHVGGQSVHTRRGQLHHAATVGAF